MSTRKRTQARRLQHARYCKQRNERRGHSTSDLKRAGLWTPPPTERSAA